MRETSQNKQDNVKSLLSKGETIRQVSQKTGISKSVIGRIAKKSLPDRLPGKSGRPSLLSPANKRYCVRKVTAGNMDNAVKVKKELEKETGVVASVDTVRPALRASGLGAIEKKKKSMLTKANAKKRLEWCKMHLNWTIDDWKRVIWSDETKINRFNSDGRVWAWIRDGESIQPKHVKVSVKHGGGSIMLWSAITYAGTGWMCKIDGNMDKILYKEILEDDQAKTIDFAC
jgi:transposase